MKIPKELIKEYVKSENFTNIADIMESIKSMFADVLNEVLKSFSGILSPTRIAYGTPKGYNCQYFFRFY